MMKLSITLLIIAISFSCFADNILRWTQNYYKNPQPNLLVKNVKQICKNSAFQTHDVSGAMVVFISQVFKQNPNKIDIWLNQFKGESKNNLNMVYEAALLSDTQEAQDYFKANNITEYTDKTPVNIFELPMDRPQIMDWMWAYFFATGKKKPIKRLVNVLDYAKYQGSIDAYKNSKKADEDKQKAIYDAMFQAALWSLQSNAQNYKLVKKYLEEIVQEKTLSKNEHIWLFFILSKIDPQKYKIKIGK